MSQKLEIKEIKFKLNASLAVIQIYKELINSYVLDFFIDDHWNRLPQSWIKLRDIPPENFANLLEPDLKIERNVVWPLSLLCLRDVIPRLTIPRKPKNETVKQSPTSDSNNNRVQIDLKIHPKMKNVLMKKNIKAKKQHEIEKMSQLTASIAYENGIEYIVDFGSGLGHLARLLTYGYRLNVCCLEMQRSLTDQAKELDNQMSKLASKYCEETLPKPVHVNICLTNETPFDELAQKIRNSFQIPLNDSSFVFGIIGLHPCGDLAGILTDFFLRNTEAKFLNLVGCCYFKMTVPMSIKTSSYGYPLSEYLQMKRSCLTFEAREIACHANEVYAKRLFEKNYQNLQVHSYRAAIEKIICKYWPERKHSGLRNIKHLTTFRDYCRQAVSHLKDIQIPDDEIDAPDTLYNLNNWKSVVIFYTLRLMFAPLVESVILYDRTLFLLENDCSTEFNPIFDPIISARNHIITAVKEVSEINPLKER